MPYLFGLLFMERRIVQEDNFRSTAGFNMLGFEQRAAAVLVMCFIER